MAMEYTLVDSGIDWLTATYTGKRTQEQIVRNARAVINAEMKDGEELRAWSGMGYHGYKCGGIQIGERTDSLIIRLTSGLADRCFDNFAPLATNVSRLDLQATFRVNSNVSKVIASVYRRAKRFARDRSNAARVSLYQVDKGSATVYLGSRSSDVFMRVYDKGEESKDIAYEQCVRFEIEFKSDAALCVAKHLTGNARQIITVHQLLSGHFKDRGIIFQNLTDADARASAPRRRASHLKTFHWLKESVRPSLLSLVQRGMLIDTLEALGLSEYVQPITTHPTTRSAHAQGGVDHGRKVESLSEVQRFAADHNESFALPENRSRSNPAGSRNRSA